MTRLETISNEEPFIGDGPHRRNTKAAVSPRVALVLSSHFKDNHSYQRYPIHEPHDPSVFSFESRNMNSNVPNATIYECPRNG